MVEENRVNDLKLTFNLLSRVKSGTVDTSAYVTLAYLSFNISSFPQPGPQELCTAFCTYVKKRGRTIVIDPEKDKTMVQELLDFKEKLDRIVQNCFGRSEKFVNGLKESFENFVNQRLNKPAELIGILKS